MELYERTANFIQKVVDDPKFDLSNCPWPFGLPIIKGTKGKRPGETEYTQIYGSGRTTRKWKTPEDISAIHTCLALYRDRNLEQDPIITPEIRNICPYIVINSLIMLDTAEVVQKEIPALLRRAREDLRDKGFFKSSSESNGDAMEAKRFPDGTGNQEVSSEIDPETASLISGSEGQDEKIRIDPADFKKSKCWNLLQDLLNDDLRKGIFISKRRHGKYQPRTLKRILRQKVTDKRNPRPQYIKIVENIKPVGGKNRTFKLDIPYQQIDCYRNV